jgi:hypothetical protein
MWAASKAAAYNMDKLCRDQQAESEDQDRKSRPEHFLESHLDSSRERLRTK